MDRLLHEQPGPCRADLALAVEDPGRRAPDGGVQVGVGEHDVRRLSAQLQRQLLWTRRGHLHYDPAGVRGAGEAHLVDARVLDERLAGDRTATRQHVQDARREARLQREFADQQRRERRLLGGLQDDGPQHRVPL